jgi:hypothetical protein
VLVLAGGATARGQDPPLPSPSAQPKDPPIDAERGAPTDAAPNEGQTGSAPLRENVVEAAPDRASDAPPGAPRASRDNEAKDKVLEPAPAESSSSDDALGSNPLGVDVHGFVSQGFILSTGNNYLAESKRGSFEFNEAGINFSKGLGDRLRVGMQFFVRDLGAVGNYTPRVDWFNLDYRFADWFGIRAGRLKVPFGLYNEINDIDSARVPVLLPQSVYPILNRDILLAQTGGEVYGYVPIKPAGALEYRLYGGTLYLDPPVAKPPLALKKFDVPYVFGGRLMWEAPLDGLRVGGSVQTLRFDTTYTLPAMPPAPPPELTLGIPFVLWLGSLEYAAHDILFAAEYGRWKANLETTIAGAMQSDTVVNERYYVMGAYRVTPWFSPGVYYSHLVENVDKPMTRDNFQDDLAVTLRFDLTTHWLLKLEGHYMHGTLDLSSDLNGGTARNLLERDWAVFFVKTTAHF